MTFKERVASVAINQATAYQNIFVEWEYLMCSEAFVCNDYYILTAKEDNYQHLVGINTPNLSPKDFFDKCLLGTLKENDFDFCKRGRPEKEVKGSVRKKIKALPHYISMFNSDIVAQENFSKNNVICSFATTDCNMTIGYINNSKAVPKSLMLGDTIDWRSAAFVDLVLKRKPSDNLFSEIVIGDGATLLKYKANIEDVVLPELFRKFSGIGENNEGRNAGEGVELKGLA